MFVRNASVESQSEKVFPVTALKFCKNRIRGDKAAEINNNAQVDACTSMKNCGTIIVITDVCSSTSCLRHLGVLYRLSDNVMLEAVKF